MPMPSSRRTADLRSLALLAVAAALPWAAAPACAQPAATPPVASAASAPSLRLFPDSELVTRDRISVEVVGRGPDVLLIPGLASSRETWRRTAERLRGRYRLHLVQVAGFAGEPARANASGPVFEPVLEEIDAYAAGLGRPIVVGHSLGGTLGLALAERHPEHLSKLLIVDSLPFYGVLMGGPTATAQSVRPMADAILAQMTGGMPAAQTRAMMAQMVTAPADVDRVTAWSLASTPQVVGRAMTEDMVTDLRPGLAAVTTPVTVLYETPLETMVQAGYETLRPKRLVAVPDARHFIMYDQPARFDAALDAFLAQ